MEKFKIIMFIAWVMFTIGSIVTMVLAMCIADYPKEYLTLTAITTTIGLLTTTALAEDL